MHRIETSSLQDNATIFKHRVVDIEAMIQFLDNATIFKHWVVEIEATIKFLSELVNWS